MPVSRQEASEALEDFKREYTGLSQVKYVLLENKKDFHDHYGPNAERAVQAWAGKLGAYSRAPLKTPVFSPSTVKTHSNFQICSFFEQIFSI